MLLSLYGKCCNVGYMEEINLKAFGEERGRAQLGPSFPFTGGRGGGRFPIFNILEREKRWRKYAMKSGKGRRGGFWAGSTVDPFYLSKRESHPSYLDRKRREGDLRYVRRPSVKLG